MPENSQQIAAGPVETVLVLGASGMLGNAVLRYFVDLTHHRAYGSVRSQAARRLLPSRYQAALVPDIDVEDDASLQRLFAETSPTVVINCIGLVKQLKEAQDPVAAISINSLLPHRLARMVQERGARLVHLSTDCVFTGSRGMYLETDLPDATDIYGRSKLLGEVSGRSCLTLRTSIIGHELATSHSLISWFLSQSGTVAGFRKAVFSGLPAGEIAHVIAQYVIPNRDLEGLWHLSAEPIDKYALLRLVAGTYGHKILIAPQDTPEIDRSLNSSRFRERTGYMPPDWPSLVRQMQEFG